MNSKVPKSTREVPRRKHSLLLSVALFLLIILPRLYVVAETVTIDEDKWLTRSGNFRYALHTRNWPDTYQKEHPGVITMWVGALGLSYLLHNGQLVPDQITQPELAYLLEINGYELLDGLVATRVVMILLIGLILMAAFVYARRLLGTTAAVIGILLIAFSPFYAGHTKLLHPDSLVGPLMLLSLLAFIYYVNGNSFNHLIISGISAGMAWLTKSPAFLLVPTVALIWLQHRYPQYRHHPEQWRLILRDGFFIIASWVLVGLAVFIILWPSMWVSPIGTIDRMFSANFNHIIGGHDNPNFFNGRIYQAGERISILAAFYLVTYLWRSSPVTLAGLVLALIGLVRGKHHAVDISRHNTLLSLSLAAVLVFVALEFGNKKFDRYLLPAYGPLLLVAGAGWDYLFRWLNSRRPAKLRLDFAALALVITIQGVFLAQSYPYYLSFYNPLLAASTDVTDVMMVGWGETLDAAADYLNTKEEASSLRVASWYRPSFAYYFEGRAIDIPSYPNEEQLARILAADYLVIYINQKQRDLPSQVLEMVQDSTPEYTIRHNEITYAQIFKLPL